MDLCGNKIIEQFIVKNFNFLKYFISPRQTLYFMARFVFNLFSIQLYICTGYTVFSVKNIFVICSIDN